MGEVEEEDGREMEGIRRCVYCHNCIRIYMQEKGKLKGLLSRTCDQLDDIVIFESTPYCNFHPSLTYSPY